MNNEKRLVYNDENIIVRTTGHDYDFIAVVEAKIDDDVAIRLWHPTLGELAPLYIEDEWIGIIADEQGYAELEAFEHGKVDSIPQNIQERGFNFN